MPTVSGNVGAVFNGGTITQATTIAPASPTATALALKPATGATADNTTTLELYDDAGNRLGYIDADGDFFLQAAAAQPDASFLWQSNAAGALFVDGTGLYATLTTTTGTFNVQGHAGAKIIQAVETGAIGFFGATPAAKPTVTGSKAANAALGSLMTALVALGLVTDSTT